MPIAPVTEKNIDIAATSLPEGTEKVVSLTKLAFARPEQHFEKLSGLFGRTQAAAAAAVQERVLRASDGSWSSENLRVNGPFNAVESNPSAPGSGNAAYADRASNGNAYRITTANQSSIDQPPLIFINGINTSLAGARVTAASVGELTGSNIDLVYNSSDPAVGAKVALAQFHNLATKKADAEASKGIRWSLRHGLELPFMVRARVYRETMASATFGREGGEWARYNALNNPPASRTAANLILDQLNSHRGPVNVAGYSQGGAIAADALRRVESHLIATHGREKANEMLGRVRFLGIGAAAENDDFPAGVKFNGIAHIGDVVPEYFGISRNRRAPGLGAILKALKPGNGFGVEQHVNYLDNQHGVGSAGDPAVEGLIRRWYGGVDIGERVIRDFEP